MLGTVLGAGVSTTARAGGFEQGDQGARAVGRGGAFAVGVDDLTALHYNPGKLALLRGTRLAYSHNLTFHDTRFRRATLSDAWGMDAGTTFSAARDREKLFALAPFFVLASDFGLENWAFAIGAYGPSAIGKHDYGEYGPASFMITDTDVVLAYYSVAAAWKLRDVFGLGVTLQYVDMPRMDYGMVVDATTTTAPPFNPVPIDPDDPDDPRPSTQMITKLRLKDRTGFTALAGLWYRPHQRIELGLAGRVVPVFLKPKGPVDTDQDELAPEGLRASMKLTLPAQLRGGIRYIHPFKGRELFDVELNAFWENWSVIDEYKMNFKGRINGMTIAPLVLEKNWKDTVAVRLGGDVNVIEDVLALRLGGFWESGAAPEEYSHLDFPSFMRGGISGGVTGGYRGVNLTVGYMHIFQEDREVTELESKVFQQRPTRPCPDFCNDFPGVPANAGTFRSRFDILALMLDIDFNTLIGPRKNRKAARG